MNFSLVDWFRGKGFSPVLPQGALPCDSPRVFRGVSPRALNSLCFPVWCRGVFLPPLCCRDGRLGACRAPGGVPPEWLFPHPPMAQATVSTSDCEFLSLGHFSAQGPRSRRASRRACWRVCWRCQGICPWSLLSSCASPGSSSGSATDPYVLGRRKVPLLVVGGGC